MLSTKWIVTGLLTLNVVMGAALVLRSAGGGEKTAYAQFGGQPNLVTVPGAAKGSGVLYILNSNNGQLAVLYPDPVGKQINVMTTIDVSKDLAAIK